MLLRCQKYVINFIDISLNLQVLTRDDAFLFSLENFVVGVIVGCMVYFFIHCSIFMIQSCNEKSDKIVFFSFFKQKLPCSNTGKKLKPIRSIFYCFVSKNGTDQFKVFFKNLNIYAVCLPRWKLVSCKPLKTEFIMETVIDPFVQHQKYNTI